MDAIAILSIVKHSKPVVFLARSDVFNNNLLKKIMKFLKIMPAYRIVDGIQNLKNNNAVFESCVEILHNGNYLCIMPEGYQGEQKKLRPLKKGIFRIAFTAQEKWGNNNKVKIIPVGIDLGDLIEAKKHIIINIGKPIEIGEYMFGLKSDSISTYNIIKEKLRFELSQLTIDIASAEHYNTFESILNIMEYTTLNKFDSKNSTFNEFKQKQLIINKLLEIKDEDIYSKLEMLSNQFYKITSELKLKDWMLKQKNIGLLSTLTTLLILLITLPFFVIGLILNALPFYTPIFIRKLINPSYEGFYSSIHFALGMFTYPFFYLLQTCIFYFTMHCSIEFSIGFFISQFILEKIAVDWYQACENWWGNIRMKRISKRKVSEIKKLNEIRTELNSIIFKQG
jgi:hypothetical protein